MSISSGSSEDTTWKEEVEKEQREIILEQNFEDVELRIGDFVLVKVSRKKSVHLYCAVVAVSV